MFLLYRTFTTYTAQGLRLLIRNGVTGERLPLFYDFLKESLSYRFFMFYFMIPQDFESYRFNMDAFHTWRHNLNRISRRTDCVDHNGVNCLRNAWYQLKVTALLCVRLSTDESVTSLNVRPIGSIIYVSQWQNTRT